MSDSIINSIYEFFDNCPLISKSDKINIDHLSSEPTEYCIEAEPCTPCVKRYVSGGGVYQYLFIFASRRLYGENDINFENSEFYERLADWIEEQNELNNLPKLPQDCECQKIEVLTHGYVLQADSDNARYQIQCRLKYFKE